MREVFVMLNSNNKIFIDYKVNIEGKELKNGSVVEVFDLINIDFLGSLNILVK